ncbi:MAG: orotidine-5'-phosphate decarboxylase [Bacteroidales bacterium]|nr:orotidine-5'-phosphate decarboxylase [Bacteroidales bacterium]
MNFEKLVGLIKEKKSFLCVGLDTDPDKIPAFLNSFEDPVFEFNKRIINATLPFTVAYKPNLAFYESYGSKGWRSLEKTMEYIRSLDGEVFTIADAKRGDIGNSAARYAKAFFETLGFDSVTVSPYMGYDSVQPFLAYKDKWTILLALTSNKGSDDFQVLKQNIESGQDSKLFEVVIKKSLTWENSRNIMFVVGATKAEMIESIRKIAPDSFLLVPGVGAQGGSLKDVADAGLTGNCGLLINASRSIIFAASDENFDQAAAYEASKLQKEMEGLLKEKDII